MCISYSAINHKPISLIDLLFKLFSHKHRSHGTPLIFPGCGWWVRGKSGGGGGRGGVLQWRHKGVGRAGKQGVLL